MFGWHKNDDAVQGWVSADVGVVNDTNTHAQVTFPTAWTARVQTPVKRVPAATLWSQPAGYFPLTYGGPQA